MQFRADRDAQHMISARDNQNNQCFGLSTEFKKVVIPHILDLLNIKQIPKEKQDLLISTLTLVYLIFNLDFEKMPALKETLIKIYHRLMI